MRLLVVDQSGTFTVSHWKVVAESRSAARTMEDRGRVEICGAEWRCGQVAMGRIDFFVSYNKADKSWAAWIAWQLEAAGYTLKIQDWDFSIGSNFVHEMDQAVKDAERTVCLLSPDYLASQFASPEWYAAFAHDPTGVKWKLVLIRVRECELSGLLAQIVYLDLVGTDRQQAQTKLLQGVKPGRRKPDIEPDFPGSLAKHGPTSAEPRFPGTLPDIFQVPHRRNPEFTGRAQLLDDLHIALTKPDTATIVQAIHGMGGVGKTQIAVEYAYRFGHAYDGVWWLNADTSEELLSGLVGLAVRLRIVDYNTMQTEAVEKILDWLRTNGERWLLVCDNATVPQAVRDYLPRAGNSRALLTSRHPHWKSMGAGLIVRVWERAESLAYLRMRTMLDDPKAAGELAQELGDLPLALAQATGYIRETACSISEYLALFLAQRQDLWQQEIAPSEDGKTIATTWSVALSALSPQATDLMQLCAFFAPEFIPWEMLIAGAKSTPAELVTVLGDPLQLNSVKKEVAGFGLAEVTMEGLIVHRLVQTVVRDGMTVGEQHFWCQTAGALLSASFQCSDDPQDWPGIRQRMPHALYLGEALAERGLAPEAAAKILAEAGRFHQKIGAYAAARTLLLRSVEVRENDDFADRCALAISYNNLATVEANLGNLVAAKTLLERTIAIEEKTYPSDHARRAVSYGNFATVELRLGNAIAAKALMEKSIAIQKKNLTANDPSLAISYGNLATVETSLGNLAAAKALVEQAIAIQEKVYPDGHPTLAVSYTILATVELHQTNAAAAKLLLERAIAIDERDFSQNHPTLVTSYSKLALAEEHLGHPLAALEWMRKAAGIAKEILPHDHTVRREIESWLDQNEHNATTP